MVFSSNRDTPNYQIYSATGPGGQGLIRLTVTSGTDTYARWSPDGSRIAFTSNRDGNYEIYVMNANGSNVHNVSNNPATDQFPAWSPDGQSLVFMSDRDGNQEVYSMLQDGSNQTNLTNSPSSSDRPSEVPASSPPTRSVHQPQRQQRYLQDEHAGATW
jgi:TolB protein